VSVKEKAGVVVECFHALISSTTTRAPLCPKR